MLSHSAIIPVIAVGLALIGLVTQWRMDLTGQRLRDTIGLLGLVFVAKYMLLPDNPRYTQLFPSQPLALSVGEFALVLQSVFFFARRKSDRLSFLLPGLGVVTLTCVAIVEVDLRERELFQAACVAFVMLASLYCDASRQFVTVHPTRRFGRPLAATVCLLIVGSTAWFLASSLFRYERQMDMWVRQYLMNDFAPKSVGLSNRASIGSVSLRKSQESASVALRVSSTTQPDYFRGRAFSEYQDSQWFTELENRTLTESDQRPQSIGGAGHLGREFPVSDAPDATTTAFEVWPTSGLTGSYPAPQGVVWLQADCIDVMANQHGILQSQTAVTGTPYTLHVRTENPGTTIRAPHERLSQPPEWAVDNPQLRELANRLFTDCTTTSDRIEAATGYFHDYSYTLEVAVPSTWAGDPVAWFLLEQPAAHCEFFASGTAVLLRMAGVPCRYVTGFVFTGKNRFSGEWIARNRDAHAWVEAWDAETRQWVTVESTPASGVPQTVPESNWSQFSEYLAYRFQQLRLRWQQEGIRLIGHLVLSALLSPVGMGLFGTALVVVAIIMQRRLRPARRSAPRRVDQSLEPLHAVLQLVDQSVAKRCRKRAVGETLTAFAHDLRRESVDDPGGVLKSAAAWYRTYAALRYSAARRDAEIEQLRQRGRELVLALRGR